MLYRPHLSRSQRALSDILFKHFMKFTYRYAKTIGNKFNMRETTNLKLDRFLPLSGSILKYNILRVLTPT